LSSLFLSAHGTTKTVAMQANAAVIAAAAAAGNDGTTKTVAMLVG